MPSICTASNESSLPKVTSTLLKLKPSMLLRIPNSPNTLLLPITDCILYLKTTRNYIALSMLLSLSTSPTTVLKKFESDKNSLLIVNSNSPSIRDSNNVSDLWCERYVDENIHLNKHIPPRPLHGIPQDPLDPIDEILHLYNNIVRATIGLEAEASRKYKYFGSRN